jgi:mannose-6-phosphate isomerase-like protein (cupin superfamily)
MPVQPFVAEDTGVPSEGWNEPEGRGVVGWQTLLSGDLTPSDALTAGIAHLEPGGHLALHRHEPAEMYFLLEGEAVLTLDGVERRIAKGACVFIPGDVQHGIRNDGGVPVRFLYVFPTDSFADVVYRFAAAG